MVGTDLGAADGDVDGLVRVVGDERGREGALERDGADAGDGQGVGARVARGEGGEAGDDDGLIVAGDDGCGEGGYLAALRAGERRAYSDVVAQSFRSC